jgi:probable F420-dependent oxidoreductase
MNFGVFMHVSGRAAGRDTMMQSARRAEEFGFEAVWAADRIIIPWEIAQDYPYSEGSAFIVPPDRPFMEPLAALAFLAGCTETIRLGVSVLVLPYRHPLFWAKIVTSIDRLSEGRFILGVGVGWMVEEFEAMDALYEQRGAVANEQLDILNVLLTEDHATFKGEFYSFEDIAFYPKSHQESRIPVWVGGEGKAAQRRAGTYGDAWFPYFVWVKPSQLKEGFENAREHARKAGRDPDELVLNCCRPIVITDEPVEQKEDTLKGTPEQLIEALKGYEEIGIQHMALQFMVPRYPDRVEAVQRFAEEIMPHF